MLLSKKLTFSTKVELVLRFHKKNTCALGQGNDRNLSLIKSSLTEEWAPVHRHYPGDDNLQKLPISLSFCAPY